MPPNFPNLAVSTDADHWIDIRIKDNIPQNKDFTFSGWFRISNPDGALFHYKSDDTTEQFLELKAVLKNSSIIFTRKLKTANETGSIGVTLSPNSWNYLAFGIDINNGKMEIYHSETRILQLDNNLMNDIDIKLPGILRIGSSFDEVDPNFDGAVTCFAYHHKLNVPSSDSENECKNTTPDESYIPICPDRNAGTYTSINIGMSNLQNTTKAEKLFPQAHTPVKPNLPVSFTLREQFNINQSTNEDLFISSCIKTGTTLVFIELSNYKLIICISDGTNIHHIPLFYTPYYVTQIYINTVAVPCEDRTILIINISTRSVTSTINTSGPCWGISYNDNNL
ncbi:unnamed protein product [Mytilus edulis]|uniref:Uncharacterized protein n=1 Tax=Mytilus edulis TaxID=6550 RepID=A0A8S3UXX9_MYTED|nr:unnamed protein product [Mytilus edulis]